LLYIWWPLGELEHWWGNLDWVGNQCIKSWFEIKFGEESTKEGETCCETCCWK